MKAIPKAIFTFIIIALCSFAVGCEYLDARDAAHAGEKLCDDVSLAERIGILSMRKTCFRITATFG